MTNDNMEESAFFARMAREIRDAADDCAALQVDMVIADQPATIGDDGIVNLQRLDQVTQILTDLAAALDVVATVKTDGTAIPAEALRRAIRLRSVFDRLSGAAPAGRNTAAERATMFHDVTFF
ncbi:hypothetical protein [Paracoccus pacificus]|uniref:Uncharacterized protein n=1 Tax=Paracoccus pacificus TaxID=1463598 RepID=A0ABW4R592_9RHOB